MLEALKTLATGKSAQKQSEELEQLIATAREERNAISAMLTALTTRSAKLTPLSKSLEQMTDKATSVTTRLDEISKRLAALDDRTRELEELDKRIVMLKDAARQAEQTTQKAIGPDGELRKHREAVQQLSSQALQTQATLDTLKKEQAALEELRTRLRESEGELGQTMSQVAAVKTAVAERLERLVREPDEKRANRKERLRAIARDTGPRLARTCASDKIGDLLYNEQGLPG